MDDLSSELFDCNLLESVKIQEEIGWPAPIILQEMGEEPE